MALFFITGNKNKLAEIQAMIPNVEQLELDLPELQEIDAHEIIKAKLHEARKHHDGEFIVEDTSLYFEGLNGLPGPLIKWFLQSLGHDGLTGLANKIDNTKATAKTIIGYSKDNDSIEFFEGAVEGKIVSSRGEVRFGWDSIFLPDGYEKTYAEMLPEEKNSMSHRHKAVTKLSEHLLSKQN